MAGKRRRIQPQRAAKKPKIAIPTRQQVLPTDTLLDIFDASERTDLDAWNIVSRQYIQLIRRAKPLRTVDEVTLSRDGRKKVYRTVFFYVDEDERQLELWDASSNAADHLAFFFLALRFCYIDGPLKIGSVSIDREFLSGLTSQGRFHFQRLAPQFGLGRLRFGRHRAVGCSLRVPVAKNPQQIDAAVPASVAPHGERRLPQVACFAWNLRDRMRGGSARRVRQRPARRGCHRGFDFCFGDYDDGGKERLLHVTDAQLTHHFIRNLVEACRASKSNHKLTLKIAISEVMDDLELAVDGMEDSAKDGSKWELSVDGMDLHILYHPFGTRYDSHGLFRCVRNHGRKACSLF
ncbi:hypothetical protein AAVH_09453 [Aphelenchoides avenae]|nr:hypothetical protein AAVH_09453 [Aphelenchus avenae]